MPALTVSAPGTPNLTPVDRFGAKYFELVAQPVVNELIAGVQIQAYGYNGVTPGPTIVVQQGDTVSVKVLNKLPDGTSVHWHGLDIPNPMDGVPDIEPSPLIRPGEAFTYQFRVVNPPGTHLYHTHVNTATQEMMGLAGALIILPAGAASHQPDHDLVFHLQEWQVKGLPHGQTKPGTYEIDPHAHDHNFFTINGKSFPNTVPIEVRKGDRVRLRLINSMMNAHPMHLHGMQFWVTAADGNPIPERLWLRRNEINVASGETYDIEFVAVNPGIWPFHCHIPHHMANNHAPGTGGMFTTIRIT